MDTPTQTLVASAAPAPDRTLDHLPVGLFGAATGIGGLGAAWRLAHQTLGWPAWPSEVLAAAALLAFGVMTIAYLAKAAIAPHAVRAEFTHPVSGNLFGLIPIALMLLPIPLAPLTPRLATALWAIGAVACLVFTVWALYRWMNARQQIETAMPAWIIPVAGPLNLSIALPALGLENLQELATFAFAIGLFFSLLVFTLIFSRLLFHEAPPAQTLPALLILTAPFSIGYSAYRIVTGQADLFAQSLFMIDLLLLCVLIPLLRHLRSCCPFRVTWWAVSFPLAASTVAALHFAAASPSRVNEGIAEVLLTMTTLTVLWLLVRTTVGVARGELRRLVGA